MKIEHTHYGKVKVDGKEYTIDEAEQMGEEVRRAAMLSAGELNAAAHEREVAGLRRRQLVPGEVDVAVEAAQMREAAETNTFPQLQATDPTGAPIQRDSTGDTGTRGASEGSAKSRGEAAKGEDDEAAKRRSKAARKAARTRKQNAEKASSSQDKAAASKEKEAAAAK